MTLSCKHMMQISSTSGLGTLGHRGSPQYRILTGGGGKKPVCRSVPFAPIWTSIWGALIE